MSIPTAGLSCFFGRPYPTFAHSPPPDKMLSFSQIARQDSLLFSESEEEENNGFSQLIKELESSTTAPPVEPQKDSFDQLLKYMEKSTAPLVEPQEDSFDQLLNYMEKSTGPLVEPQKDSFDGLLNNMEKSIAKENKPASKRSSGVVKPLPLQPGNADGDSRKSTTVLAPSKLSFLFNSSVPTKSFQKLGPLRLNSAFKPVFKSPLRPSALSWAVNKTPSTFKPLTFTSTSQVFKPTYQPKPDSKLFSHIAKPTLKKPKEQSYKLEKTNVVPKPKNPR